MKQYRYRDDIATADAVYEAWGTNPEELFIAAVDAAVNVMLENLEDIAPSRKFAIHCESESLEMLLYSLLEEIIYFKDAETLLLRVSKITIKPLENSFFLDADVYGEKINPEKHSLNVDVKAVTLYHFRVEETAEGWKATVVLDI